MSGLRIVRAAGDPYERGRTIGRALARTIRDSVAYNLDHFERRGLGRAAIERLAPPLLAAAGRCLPDELAALHGMADGAGLSVLEVLVPNAYEELEPWLPVSPSASGPPRRGPVQRCSALTVAAPGVTLLGHDEQWLAGEPGQVVLIVEVPDDPGEPAVVSPTVASWRPSVGMTVAGHAQGVMSLTASDDRPGIPRVLVSCATLAARDRADAVRRATPDERSGGYAYLHAFRGGETCLVETSATHAVREDGPAVHTNHYLDRDLARIGAAPSAGSKGRYERIAALASAVTRPRTPEALMRVLADHDSTPSSICLHAEPSAGDDTEAVLFAMVCDVEAGRMWVAPGRPCETSFESFDVAALVAG